MAKKKIPAEIRIETLQQLMDAATADNFQLLERDLVLWFRVNMGFKAAGIPLGGVSMIWKDDGINAITGARIEYTKAASPRRKSRKP